MTVTQSINKITEWLNKGVCTKYKFKVPPDMDKHMGDRYEYQEVNPHAFPLFMPPKDKLPPDIKTNIPSITVQLNSGSDDLSAQSREMTITLGISVWNPGTHSQDVFNTDEESDYKSGYDGWMDCWNFLDGILQALESAESIYGLSIGKNISYGPYKQQESIADYYPFWFAYIQFSVITDSLHNVEEEKEIL